MRISIILVVCTILLASQFIVLRGQTGAIVDLGKDVLNGVSIVESGELFEYVLSYSCSSIAVPCENAQIIDQLPPGLEFVDIVPTSDVATWDVSGSTVTITFIDPLPGGDSGIIRLIVRYPPGTIPGSLPAMPAVNEAEISADNAPSVSDSAPIDLAEGRFEMFARKDQLNEAVIGVPLTFELNLCSPDTLGGVALTDPVIIDRLPPEATFVTAEGVEGTDWIYDPVAGTVTWINLPNPWPVGDCLTRIITLIYNEMPVDPVQVNEQIVTGIPDGCQPGIFDPPASYCDPDDPTVVLTDTNSFLLEQPFGRWGVSKSGRTDSDFIDSEALRGELITYDLVVSNSGFLTLTNAVFTDVIPAELAFDSVTFPPVPVTSTIDAYYILASDPLTLIPFPGNSYAVTTTVTITDLALAPGAAIAAIRWEAGEIAPGMPAWRATMQGYAREDVNLGTLFTNCLQVSGIVLPDGEPPVPETITGGDCVTTEVIDRRSIPRVRKERLTSALVYPLDTLDFALTLFNSNAAHLPAINPVLMDLLPPEFVYMPGTFTLTTQSPPDLPAPALEVLPDFNGTGRTLLRARWSAAPDTYELPPGASVTLGFRATIAEGTPPGIITNTVALLTEDAPILTLNCSDDEQYIDSEDLNSNGDTTEIGCRREAQASIGVQLSAGTDKAVRGQFEAQFTNFGLTAMGGTGDYRLVVTNTSNVALSSISIVDILPHVGDRGVIDPAARESQWQPTLQTTISGPPGIPFTAWYSMATNPCRPDFVPSGPAGCQPPDWSLTPPVNPITQLPDITLVRSVRLNLCSGGTALQPTDCYELARNESVALTWRMIAPANFPGDLSCYIDRFSVTCPAAWNSFAFTAIGGGLRFRAAEPPKVGLAVGPVVDGILGDYVWLDSAGYHTDGIQQPEEEGINGVRVLLLDGNANIVLQDRITGPDANGRPGYYEFPVIASGFTYRLGFVPPENAQISPALQGSNVLSDSNGIELTNIPGVGAAIVTQPISITYPITSDFSIDQGFWYPLDFGDAPWDGITWRYPTSISLAPAGEAANAARHIVYRFPDYQIMLGTRLDDERDGQPDALALGDDLVPGEFFTYTTGLPDEDGIGFPGVIGPAGAPSGIVTRGGSNTLAFTSTLVVPSTAYLQGWIDLNRDGDWEDAGEQVLANFVATGGVQTASITIPASASTGESYARFRISTQPDVGVGGLAFDGEVEDYRIQIVDAPVKSIVATSEAHTPVSAAPFGNNTQVAIGEIVRYRLTSQLPRGELTNFRLIDALPQGLQYLGDVTVTLTATNPALITGNLVPVVTPASFVSGTDPTFTFGTLLNNSTGADVEYLNLEFNALVLNEAANQNNVAAAQRRNTFTVAYNTYQRTSNAVDVLIVEPVVTQAKSVATVPPLDAGDVVTYTLLTTAVAGARNTTAFDIVISDTLDSNLLLVPGSVVVNTAAPYTNNSAGNLINIALSALAPGQTVAVNFAATVIDDAHAGIVIPNLVRTVWTSLPGANGTAPNPTGAATPGAAGSSTGERDGVTLPANLNNYTASANAPLALALPGFAKLPEQPARTIGESATFTLLVTTTEGTLPDLVIADALPTGMRFIAQEVVTTVAQSGGLLAADFAGTLPIPTLNTTAGDGNDITWDFGAIINPADNNPANDRFLIRLVAVVENVLPNQDGVSLVNSAELRYSAAAGGSTTIPGGSAIVNLVEPVLALQKSAATALPAPDAGDTVTYTVALRHAPGSIIPAYTVLLTDTLPPGLRDAVLVSAFDSSNNAISASIAGQTLRVPAAGAFTLPVTETITIVYRAQLADQAQAGQPISNTAGAIWATLPDTFPDRRDDGLGAPDGEDLLHGGALNDYEVNASAQVTPGTLFAIAKTLHSTSAAHTPGADVTIGEVVTYSLRVTLAEGTAPNVVVTDTLPAGMAYVGASATVDASALNGTLPAPVITPAGNGASGEALVLRFGNVVVFGDNIDSNNSFSITLRALVLDLPANVGLPGMQTRLDNVAALQVGAMPPATSEIVVVHVIEPRMHIVKQIMPDLAPPQGIVTVTLVISNSGLSTAFEAAMEDILPAGLTYAGAFTETAGNGASPAALMVNGNTPGATWPVFPVNTSSTLRFRAQVAADVAPGHIIVNTATVAGATTLPGIDPNERTVPPDEDDAQVQIITHDLALSKSNNVDEFLAGGTLAYTIRITNTGAAIAPGVRITETVPNHTTFLETGSSPGWMRATNPGQACATGEAAGSVCVIAIGNLAPGASTTVTFAVRVDSPLPNDPPAISNAACVGDDGSLGSDPTPDNNCDTDVDLFRRAQLGDKVWLDMNGNGVQDADEPGYAGQVIHLYRGDETASIASTSSDANGIYFFTNLLSDTYRLQFVPQADPRLTLQHQGSDHTLDSDADRATGFSQPIALAAGEVNHTIDAGVYYLSALGDRAWEDMNANGIQEDGEPGIAGVGVELLRDGSVISSTITSASGYYLFSNLDFGTYAVRFAALPGWQVSLPNMGNDGAIDSDIDPTTRTTPDIVIGQPIQNLDLDAGFYRFATLGDYVWNDSNANGIQEAGEQGLAGVTVTLERATPSAAGAPELPATTITDLAGTYAFTNVIPGDYIVRFAADAPLRGSPRAQGDDRALDSNPDPATGQTDVIGLRSAEVNLTVDAGYYLVANIGSYAWNDLNHNGIRETNEPGAAAVEVLLFREEEGQVQGQGVRAPWQVTTTDAAGSFLFENALPGRYWLHFTLPPGFAFTIRNATDDPLTGSDVDPATGETEVFTLLQGIDDLTWGAGLTAITGDDPTVEPEQPNRTWLPAIQGPGG